MAKVSEGIGAPHQINGMTDFSPSDFEVAEFTNNIHPRIAVRPMYHELGFSEQPLVLGRRIVLDRLLRTLNFIPENYGFIIWDVYRPRAVQGRLFEWMKDEVRKKYPNLPEEDVFETSRKYMSPPSKVGDLYTPPHLSGGAIDLTLFDLAQKKELEMGTPFDDCTEKAHSGYYEKRISLQPEELAIRGRRRLLSTAMQAVGFAPYQYEWWHFDIGDVFWSRITGRPIVFGPLLDDLEWPIK